MGRERRGFRPIVLSAEEVPEIPKWESLNPPRRSRSRLPLPPPKLRELTLAISSKNGSQSAPPANYRRYVLYVTFFRGGIL